jgi:DeoR family transcriptional regulator, aga operon transcriptional repressor
MIQEYLEAHRVARLSDLVDQLGASEATVRRDLEWLEAQGIAERTHGGALLTQRLPTEPLFSASALAHPEQKDCIGRAAAALVQSDMTVFVNSGTTTAALLRHLRTRAELNNVNLVTNNLYAAAEPWDPGVEILILGGVFSSRAHSIVGRFAADMLRVLGADLAFIGVDGISLKYGVTTPSTQEAELGQLMVDRTRGQVYIVADHSKWGVVSNYEIARLDQIHGLVVDTGLEPGPRTELEERGLAVILAGPANENHRSIGSIPREESAHASVWQEG